MDTTSSLSQGTTTNDMWQYLPLIKCRYATILYQSNHEKSDFNNEIRAKTFMPHWDFYLLYVLGNDRISPLWKIEGVAMLTATCWPGNPRWEDGWMTYWLNPPSHPSLESLQLKSWCMVSHLQWNPITISTPCINGLHRLLDNKYCYIKPTIWNMRNAVHVFLWNLALFFFPSLNLNKIV